MILVNDYNIVLHPAGTKDSIDVGEQAQLVHWQSHKVSDIDYWQEENPVIQIF